MVHDITLWLFVIFSGIAAGAGLYEMRINVPRWFTLDSGGTGAVNVAAINTDDSGRRFWGFITTVPLTLLTLASCVFAWNPATAREQWWLAAAVVMLVERVGTLGYFIPTLLRLLNVERWAPAETARAARQWVRLNRVRCLLAFAGWLAALRAFSAL